jgi:hypothetical protein
MRLVKRPKRGGGALSVGKVKTTRTAGEHQARRKSVVKMYFPESFKNLLDGIYFALLVFSAAVAL